MAFFFFTIFIRTVLIKNNPENLFTCSVDICISLIRKWPVMVLCLVFFGVDHLFLWVCLQLL